MPVRVIECLVEDPATKQYRPRNYLRSLEERVALLENAEHTQPPDTPNRHIPSPARAALPASQSPVAWSITSPFPDRDGKKSDLPARVGLLDIKTSQVEPQYLGSSSAFSFSHIINSSLLGAIPDTALAEDGTSNRLEPPPSPCPLPGHSVALKLSKAYFENIHPQYPFLHEPTFRRYEATLLASPEAGSDVRSEYGGPLFILNMVYATGALLMPNSQALAERLYASALLYSDVLSRNNLEAIQGLLCHAMYSLRSRSGPSLWKLSGIALRQCIELGYHRKAGRHGKDQNMLQLEMRKRAFWCAQWIDCACALRLGRPLGIQLFDVDAELPLDINDEFITDTGLGGTPRNLPGEAPTSMSNAIHVIRLRRIWARLHGTVHSANTPGGMDSESRRSHIAELRGDLDEWLRSAPPCPPRAGAALSIFSTREWYELNYSGTILHLYRGQLAEDKGTPDNIIMDCMQAAGNVCRMYRRQYIGTSVKYTWATLHCLFLAGLTYLHCLWTSQAVRTVEPHEEVIKTSTDCTMVLVVIAEGWAGAAPYRDIFEALANRTMSMLLHGKSAAQASSQTGQDGSDNPQRDAWAWMADFDHTGVLDGFDDLLSGFMEDLAPLYDHHT
ncbi:hypothetical protein CkaCkLH20_05318 [Colletotrichum karsti]|uniref:Xylanolytic transcriptional activator regulatory domain-containing protein n=1 Tax=Colletotrichum karsti TaxID=1095194 RepID=A0A9P6LLZ2_9PEZI|nr:uncharacterized protein CkaCkLH20_05318 [Colletotrichum karsti]KAF9877052.1 hypothetical protein CkaCkLH20_05318 [Colletotrichum karsti]